MTKTINFYVILSALAAVTDAIGEHSEGLFSYDMSAANGPSEWYSLDLGDTDNACNGTKQSGIDILTGSCTETDANYKFEVNDDYPLSNNEYVSCYYL
jgi:carbonic anhydrase